MSYNFKNRIEYNEYLTSIHSVQSSIIINSDLYIIDKNNILHKLLLKYSEEDTLINKEVIELNQ